MVKNIRQKRKIFKEQGRFCCVSGLVCTGGRRVGARAMAPPSAVCFPGSEEGAWRKGAFASPFAPFAPSI